MCKVSHGPVNSCSCCMTPVPCFLFELNSPTWIAEMSDAKCWEQLGNTMRRSFASRRCVRRKAKGFYLILFGRVRPLDEHRALSTPCSWFRPIAII
eukprot:s3956_g3.t1